MTRLPYEYVVLRCVPRPEREEFVNVGVVLHCQAADYLAADFAVDRERWAAIDPRLDLDQVCAALDTVTWICAGDPRGGAAAGRPMSQRFGFVKAPRSTVIQPGPVHGGLTDDPGRQLERLLERLVG